MIRKHFIEVTPDMTNVTLSDIKYIENSQGLNMQEVYKTDVIIVGGGPTGGTLAIALASAGVEVAIIDRQDPSTTFQEKFDGRTFAISHGSCNIFKGISLWPHLEKFTEPILDIVISDDVSPGTVHYNQLDTNKQVMGVMLEHHRLKQAIIKRTKELNNLHWFAPNEVIELQRSTTNVKAKLADGTSITAALCIAADGRNSTTRTQAGIKVTNWKYKQTAIVCKIKHEFPHHGVAYEHFLPNGPFAVLPMQGNNSAIVWTENQDLAPKMLELDTNAFSKEMQKRFGEALGEIKLASQRWSFPLGVQFAHKYIDKRLALVADAAHAIHPVAGQGINLGLRDVAALAEVLVDAKRIGLDLGAHVGLEKYQRWRRFDNVTLIAATDGLIRLFSNSVTPIRYLRSIGLSLVNTLPSVRTLFTKHAMGMVGNLPRLVAGRDL